MCIVKTLICELMPRLTDLCWAHNANCWFCHTLAKMCLAFKLLFKFNKLIVYFLKIEKQIICQHFVIICFILRKFRSLLSTHCHSFRSQKLEKNLKKMGNIFYTTL